MKQRGGSALPLLIIVILLILSLFMLHNNKKSFFTSPSKAYNYTISTDLKDHFAELMHMGEYDKIAQLMDRFHFVKRVQLVRLLLYDATIQCSDDEKIQAFFKILTFSVRKDYQKALLNEFDMKKFQLSKPFLALIIDHASSILPLILSWLASHYEPEVLTKLGSQAYQYLVAQDNTSACELLLRYHVQMDKQQATNLLLDVIQGNKSRVFIPLLVTLGASLQRNIVSKKLLLYGLQKAGFAQTSRPWLR